MTFSEGKKMNQIETTSQQVFEMLAEFSNEEKLLILQKVAHLTIESSNGEICAAKVNGGACSELYACMQIKDLKWNSGENNGADAYDEQGRGVELKTFHYRRTKNCNAHLTFPDRRSNESDDEYRARVIEHFRTSPKYEGGLRIVAMDKNKSRVHHWYNLPREILPYLAENFLLKHPKGKEINITGKPCKKCHLIHRMAQMQAAAKEGRAELFIWKKGECVGIPIGQFPSSGN